MYYNDIEFILFVGVLGIFGLLWFISMVVGTIDLIRDKHYDSFSREVAGITWFFVILFVTAICVGKFFIWLAKFFNIIHVPS